MLSQLELKIPELTLAKIAQMGRHETEHTRYEHYNPKVEDSIPMKGNFLLKLVC